jgi:guanylate kinase
MALACKKPECRCEHIDCDNGYIFTTYVTKTENKARNGEIIVVETEYEGVLFCPQCDPQRAHIQDTSSSAEELQRRLSERTPIKRAEIYEKQEASKTRIL